MRTAAILLLFVTGCSRVTLYPIEGDHIVNVAQDEEFAAPRGGYFLSDEYLQKVLNAQVKDF